MCLRAAHSIIPVVVVMLVAAAVASPALAGDGPWTVGIRGAWVSPDVDYTETQDDGSTLRAVSTSEFGLGLDLEYRLNDRFGIAGGLLWSQPDVRVSVTLPTGDVVRATAGLRFMPVTAGLAIHLTPDSPVDLVLTPFATWVSYGDLDLRAPTGERQNLDIDNDFGWGASFGGSWAATDAMLVNASVSYYDTDIELKGAETADDSLSFDPFVYSVGVGFRF